MLGKYKKFHFKKYDYHKIKSAYLPQKAFISLCQDGNTVCKPCVRIGDFVKEGQVIAFNSEIGINIHSSITGEVENFVECPMPNGTKESCIIIKMKGSLTVTGKIKELKKWKYDTSSKTLMNLKQRGVINTLDGKNCCIDKQIENAMDKELVLGVVLFDSDKSSSVSSVALKFYQDLIFEGCTIIAHAMQAKSIIFFCDTNEEKYLSQSSVTELLENIDYSFIQINSDKYPSASPFKLKTILANSNTQDKEKITTNRIDIDTTTALAAYNAIAQGLPITETLVEINGNKIHENTVFLAKIGLPIQKLLEECGGMHKHPAKIVVNGLLKGKAIKNLQTPVTKYLKTVTFVSSNDFQDETVTHCINCGLCRSVCPIGLHPDIFYASHKHGIGISENSQRSAYLCDECGLCNTTCPSRLPLYQTISKIKEDKNEQKI